MMLIEAGTGAGGRGGKMIGGVGKTTGEGIRGGSGKGTSAVGRAIITKGGGMTSGVVHGDYPDPNPDRDRGQDPGRLRGGDRAGLYIYTPAVWFTFSLRLALNSNKGNAHMTTDCHEALGRVSDGCSTKQVVATG